MEDLACHRLDSRRWLSPNTVIGMDGWLYIFTGLPALQQRLASFSIMPWSTICDWSVLTGLRFQTVLTVKLIISYSATRLRVWQVTNRLI
ncbi:MAG: hypothetical protein CBD91_03565 [Phycisphaeraceae bacterium TMED231]|nr:MAG: hypothetical protein CBD91_03565 [Phycisphaeraceae bacterium TMED231]